MKKIIFSFVILLALLGISSCGLFMGTSIEDRLLNFENELNNNGSAREGIWDNFHPDSDCSAGITSLTYWNTDGPLPDGNDDYNINISSDPDETYQTTYTHNSGGPFDIKFYMKNEGNFMVGDDWLIKTLWVTDMSNPQIQ